MYSNFLKPTFLCLLIIASGVFAKADLEQVEGSDVPVTISNPNINKINFSASSDQNGLCRALGFQKAAVGSALANGSPVGLTLVASSDGTITNGEVITQQSGYYISQIVCVNYQQDSHIVAKIVEKPQLNGIYFSSNSDQNGICSSQGFSHAAVGAVKTDGTPVGSVIVVDQAGKVIGGEVVTAASGYWISEILCVRP